VLLLLLLGRSLGLLLLLELFTHPGLDVAHLLPNLFGRLVNGNDEIKYHFISQPQQKNGNQYLHNKTKVADNLLPLQENRFTLRFL